jgi:hypothetical protein
MGTMATVWQNPQLSLVPTVPTVPTATISLFGCCYSSLTGTRQIRMLKISRGRNILLRLGVLRD